MTHRRSIVDEVLCYVALAGLVFAALSLSLGSHGMIDLALR